jgi:hypothetical protein
VPEVVVEKGEDDDWEEEREGEADRGHRSAR